MSTLGQYLAWVPWWLMVAVAVLLVWFVVSFLGSFVPAAVQTLYRAIDTRVRCRRIRRRLYELANSHEGREFAAKYTATRGRHRRVKGAS